MEIIGQNNWPVFIFLCLSSFAWIREQMNWPRKKVTSSRKCSREENGKSSNHTRRGSSQCCSGWEAWDPLAALGSRPALGNSLPVRCLTAQDSDSWACVMATGCLEPTPIVHCVWRRKAKNVVGQHTGELCPLTKPTCILCVTQRREHAAAKKTLEGEF